MESDKVEKKMTLPEKLLLLTRKEKSCFVAAQKMNSNSSQPRERLPKPLYAYYALPAYGFLFRTM